MIAATQANGRKQRVSGQRQSHAQYVHSRHDGEGAEYPVGGLKVGDDVRAKEDQSKTERTEEGQKSGAS